MPVARVRSSWSAGARVWALVVTVIGVVVLAVTAAAPRAQAAPYTTAPSLAVADPCVNGANEVVGTKFRPHERVSISLTGAKNPVGTVVTDANGGFRIDLIYPDPLVGPHVITARGASGDSASSDVDIHVCTQVLPGSATLTMTPSPVSTPNTVTTVTVTPATTTPGGGGGGGGALPNTGVAVLTLLLVALGLVVGGALVLLRSRRRVH